MTAVEQAGKPFAVRAINGVGAVAQRFGLGRPFDVESLMRDASRRTGLDDFGPDTFRAGLQRLVDALNSEAQLTAIGRIAARKRLGDLLDTRLRLLDHRRRHPSVAAERIDRPIFVLGLPRTGTTVLYGMLASNPVLRSPVSWEVARPFPPPTQESRFTDPRIEQVEKEFARFRGLAPEIDRIHPLGARLPQECLALQAPEFTSYEYPCTFPVDSYWSWLRTTDLRPAYEFERMFLQHLQSGYGGKHWILKTPAHVMWLDTLLEVFPDALLVHTHRNPTAVLASVSSLMAAFRGAMSDAIDRHAIGREQLDAWTWGLNRAVAVRDTLPADRVVDVHYEDTVNDPVGTVGRVYDAFGLEMTPAISQAVGGYLAENPRDKHGAHRYALADFGLDRDEVNAAFATYRTRFALPEDG